MRKESSTTWLPKQPDDGYCHEGNRTFFRRRSGWVVFHHLETTNAVTPVKSPFTTRSHRSTTRPEDPMFNPAFFEATISSLVEGNDHHDAFTP
ncbi:MAG: hypothetical protein ACFFCS_01005 [Candidatus Hodarchaeota archaeon]